MDILPHQIAAKVCVGRPVVLLNDPGDNSRHIQLIEARASKFVRREFFDVVHAEPSYPVKPEQWHLEDIFHWVIKEDIDLSNLIVTCFGGISRSSSIAYLVACLLKVDPYEAIKYLNLEKHYPNIRIVSTGAVMQYNPEITIAAMEFILKADRLFQEQLRNGTI
jgi:predicted protein tyrosine phosphatase